MRSLSNFYKIKNIYKSLLMILLNSVLIDKIFALESKNNTQKFIKPDTFYMEELVHFAKLNPKNFPFTALIINKETGEILCEGINQTDKAPILHGEIVTIMQCAKKYPHLNWSKTILYTTAEPCPMCQSAAIWSNIPKVVYGTSIDYLSKHGWSQIKISSKEVMQKSHFYKGDVVGGVLKEKTDLLFLDPINSHK